MSALMLARPALRRANLPATRAVILLRNSATATPPADSPDSMYVAGGPIPRGTVNDALPFPTSNRAHGSHHWAFERLLSASLVPLTVTAFATSTTPYPAVDGILGVALIMHSHIGFDQLNEDYLHKRKYKVIGPIATWTLRLATVGALVGVYQFNTNDVGLTELIKRVWHA
ncbi:CybS-domain-containing protein [Auriculariales sp. MPI-PUGE-AT-0066]|nr:CybS-domain-containing protein [Auriculariales sp. MPI-PUGE-AT-0066]